MAKWTADRCFDAMLNDIATSVQLCLCVGQPADYTEATDTLGVGNGKAVALSPMSGVDYTVGDGDTSGRKNAVAAKSDLDVLATGTADHVALVTASELLYVTTTPTQSVLNGAKVSVGGWDIEVADPT